MEADSLAQYVADFALQDDSERPPPTGYQMDPPPAPKLHSKGVIAMEITEQFLNAARELALGQLIKDPYLPLFDSVGALEIMDRKMDSGCLAPGETMEDEYDFQEELLPEEILGIIDQLLCHEMAWHMGYPLSQTLFTSLHIDHILMPTPLSLDQTYFDRSEDCSDTESLLNQILRAYCLGLIKTCAFINETVKAELFFEEEDFVTHTFNRSLLEAIDHGSIVQFLNDTMDALSNDDELLPQIKLALLQRLNFRHTFLTAVEMATSRTSSELKSLWIKLQGFVPQMKSSAVLGKPVPRSFSDKLQRKLASTVPPRPIVLVSQDKAFNHLENFCRDASIAVEVLEYHDSQSLLKFVLMFQSRKPQPSVYVRTLLQHYLFADMIILGKMSIRQFLDEDLALITLPASILLDRLNDEIEIPSDPRFLMAAKMEVFRERAAMLYLEMLRTICQNRCRMRRSLCHTILEWDNLQLDAEELDLDLRESTKEPPFVDKSYSSDPIYAFPLSSWAYLYKLRQMEWIVQMGFELETYQPDEMVQMYWYLQYLAGCRARHLERIKDFNDLNNSPTRKQVVVWNQEEHHRAKIFNASSTLETGATQRFADALCCLYAVLARLSLLPTLPRPYSKDTMRYEVRMQPFRQIGLPEVLPFEEMSQYALKPERSTFALLRDAREAALQAKKYYEELSKVSAENSFCRGSYESWVKDKKACLKAAILTGITIMTVQKAVGEGDGTGLEGFKIEIPKPGEGYHDWWVVPKIATVAQAAR